MIQNDTTVKRDALKMTEIQYRPARPEDVPEFAHFLTSAPFGQMGQYLPSGPGLY